MIRRPPRSTLLEGRRQRQMCIRDRSKTASKPNEEWLRAEALRIQNEKRAQAASFQAQSWQITSEPEDDDFVDDFGSGSSMDDEISDESVWDCVACNKRFLSEAAWSNHERSKKHKKEVERLKREMLEEDLELAEDVNKMEPSISELTIHDAAEENLSVSRKKDLSLIHI